MHHGLRHGPLGPNCLHICVDMQDLFGPGSPWAVAWLERIESKVVDLCARHPARTVFTRFVPPMSADQMPGSWQRYYQKWEEITLARIGPAAVALRPALRGFVPPARVIDKMVYSPWLTPQMDLLLRQGQIDTLILSGGETDVCVLATAMGAIDRGLRVIMAADALCSGSDLSHDELMDLYMRRFDMQIETAETEEILDGWRG